MAKTCFQLALSFTLISYFISHLLILAIQGNKEDDFISRLSPTKLKLHKEKLTHFRVYWQDVVSGSHPTSIPIVTPPKSSSSNGFFGTIVMIDNALTAGPGLDSKLVGRAQGMYAPASQTEVSAMMVMNFAFIQGKYNGSTISIFGRNTVFLKVREMPIIGGSGVFRFARGYVQARTHALDLKTGDATVEYNVYVLHY